jgi:hypothetical protein
MRRSPGLALCCNMVLKEWEQLAGCRFADPPHNLVAIHLIQSIVKEELLG